MVVRIETADATPASIYFKEWRELRGLTQQELADQMETTKQTISRIENGQRDWGKGFLEGFAHVIGCEISDPITRPPGEPSIDQLLRNATSDQKQQAFAIIQAMLATGNN